MKTWMRLAAVAVLATILAACSREDRPTAETVQPVADIDTAATVKALKRPLARGVDLSFDHHLRRDRVEETKSGVFRRRVLIEYLALEQQQAASTLISDMAKADYKLASERTQEDGRIRITFQKGKRKITALVRHGGKLQNPAATGAILISIPAKAPQSGKDNDGHAADPAQTAAPAAG